MSTIVERVAAGAAWLDETRPTWIEEIDLGRLNLSSGCDCVLGQIVGYERDRVDEHYVVEGYDEGYRMRFDTADLWGYENVVDVGWWTARQLARVDHLGDLVMTQEVACDRGFHLGDNETLVSWWSLTNEWRRVIEARRSGS